MAEPAVSVLVPVFNGEPFLSQALTSIGHQTFVDYEAIIADDASTDDSSRIAAEWSSRDPRFRVSRTETNLGMTANWNRALALARGAYVVKLDCDDALRPRMLEELVGHLEANPGNRVAYCRTLSCDESLEPVSCYRGDLAFYRHHLDPLQPHARPAQQWYEMCFEDIQLWHSNAQMHRRADLLAIGGWDETWGCAADTDLILRILERGGPIHHLPYVGVYYRHRTGSVSDSFRTDGRLRVENVLVHLLSLARQAAAGKLSPRLRKAWFRFWRNFRLWGFERSALAVLFEPRQRDAIVRAISGVERPPLGIRAEGALRQSVSQTLRWLDQVRGRAFPGQEAGTGSEP